MLLKIPNFKKSTQIRGKLDLTSTAKDKQVKKKFMAERIEELKNKNFTILL